MHKISLRLKRRQVCVADGKFPVLGRGGHLAIRDAARTRWQGKRPGSPEGGLDAVDGRRRAMGRGAVG